MKKLIAVLFGTSVLQRLRNLARRIGAALGPVCVKNSAGESCSIARSSCAVVLVPNEPTLPSFRTQVSAR